MIDVINTGLDVVVYLATGAVISWYFFKFKRKALAGGYWGGFVIAIVGSVMIAWIFGTWFIELVSWLMNPKQFWGDITLRVNLIAAILGAYLFVAILNRINHDKDR